MLWDFLVAIAERFSFLETFILLLSGPKKGCSDKGNPEGPGIEGEKGEFVFKVGPQDCVVHPGHNIRAVFGGILESD